MITHYQATTSRDILVDNKIHLSHLILEVGNNGCGPDSVEDFVMDIQMALKTAKNMRECITIGGYAGMKDLLVYPNGSFSVIDTSHLIRYRLII